MADITHPTEQEPTEGARPVLFADQITARIRDHGATYRSLEEASGITDASWANWHRGALPNKSLIPAAAKALGVDEEALRTLIADERTARQQADTAVHRALPEKPRASNASPTVTSQALAAAEAACEAAYTAADAAQATLDAAIEAATDAEAIADAEAICKAAYAMADAAASALATASKAHANSVTTLAERAVADAAVSLIEARRARIHAGIPIDTREQTQAWIDSQRPAPATTPSEGG